MRRLKFRFHSSGFFIGLLAFTSGLIPLTSRAQDLVQLARKPEWLSLLHFFEKSESEITSTSPFFLSPQGSEDPLAELTATISAFESPKPEVIGVLNQTALCAFPARRRFLESNGYRFRPSSCRDFLELKQATSPESLSLVFSTHYSGNPASLFGHTLIRINRGAGERLRDYAVNFAASVPPGEIGLKYVPYGLLGLYPGYFQISPYYLKVLEYNEAESRDLWEYELTYTREETERWLEHLWEIRWLAQFRYTFLMKNCSYQMNRTLQVIRPELGPLLPSETFYALPGETIRVIAKQHPELIRRVSFRASHRRILRHELSQLTPSEKLDLQLLFKNLPSPPGELKNPRVLEVALHQLEFEKIEQQVADTPVLDHSLRSLRVARAKLPAGSALAPPPVPVDPTNRPDHAHGTRRISLGALGGNGFSSEWSIRARAGLHDRLDRDAGSDPSFSLSFLDVEFSRRNSTDPRYRLRRFELLKLESWEPIQFGDHPLSWGLMIGGVPFDEPHTKLNASSYFKTKGEGGFTIPVDTSKLSLTALLGLEIDLDQSISRKKIGSLPVRIHANYRLNESAKFSLYGSLRAPLAFESPEILAGFESSVATTRETSLTLDLKRIERSFVYQTKGSLLELRWGVFF
ncbi:MAG: DUF4105 domain-containing protein [Proteobacteria bacterium]|nr:MAG: DUF4105 domain-containing protein [Pseudomonadota bacterium]